MALITVPVQIAALATIAILALYKLFIYPAFISPLSRIPNAHFTAPFSPLWILWQRFRMRGNRTIHAAHQKYGPIVRLGPSELSINTVDGGIRTVYAGGFEKHDWYPRLFGSHGTVSMFSMVGSKPHSARKRMLSNIYSKSYLQTSPHLALISNSVLFDRFLPTVQETSETGSAVEVHDLNNALTMDFVSAYIFGLQNGTRFLQDVPLRTRWFNVYQSRKPFEYYYQEIPRITAWASALRIPIIPKWTVQANKEIEEWALDLCDKADKCCSSTDPASEPLVYKQLKQGMSKQQISSKEYQSAIESSQRMDIACELYDQVTAGFETSAVALTYLWWEMSRNPDLQVELRQELGTLSPKILYPLEPDARPDLPSPKTIDALQLLNGIVMETLRLHSPIPGIQPRITPSSPTTLVGYDNIPANTRVNAQAYSLHQNPEVFPEPDQFQPRRWLKDPGSPEMESMKRWFWAFGSGGRMCVGSNLALQEIKLAVAAVYSNFKTEIVDDEGIEAIDAYTVRPTSNKLMLRFEHI